MAEDAECASKYHQYGLFFKLFIKFLLYFVVLARFRFEIERFLKHLWIETVQLEYLTRCQIANFQTVLRRHGRHLGA